MKYLFSCFIMIIISLFIFYSRFTKRESFCNSTRLFIKWQILQKDRDTHITRFIPPHTFLLPSIFPVNFHFPISKLIMLLKLQPLSFHLELIQNIEQQSIYVSTLYRRLIIDFKIRSAFLED